MSVTARVISRRRREQVFFSFFRFAFFIFPDFSPVLHFSCPRFHFAFFLSAISFRIFTSHRSHFEIPAPRAVPRRAVSCARSRGEKSATKRESRAHTRREVRGAGRARAYASREDSG